MGTSALASSAIWAARQTPKTADFHGGRAFLPGQSSLGGGGVCSITQSKLGGMADPQPASVHKGRAFLLQISPLVGRFLILDLSQTMNWNKPPFPPFVLIPKHHTLQSPIQLPFFLLFRPAV